MTAHASSSHDSLSLVSIVRDFVRHEVEPVASTLEHADTYPHALVARMKELGLFGALVPRAYGGLGVDVTTYARVIEEICRGWMSLAGVLNSHTMAALIVLEHGTDEQRGRLLPRFARGEARGGLCLTEPHAGSDVQAIRAVARREGNQYLISGSKMFVTNGREGNTFALLALTDPAASPRHRGMSCFIVEKGAPGLEVVKSIAKLGYKGVDTAELHFDDFPVPAANLVGGVEGRGFKHVMAGLETGRINIAARAVGVAQAALEEAARAVPIPAEAPPTLGEIAIKVESARLLTHWASAMKDRGQRCDLEAGMAKLHASEAAQDAAVAAMRILGPTGQRTAFPVERLYRDTPLMLIGEGTNEIQRLVICKNLLERYGERLGALTSREEESPERRQLVLAVRQLVEKDVLPVVHEHEQQGRYPAGVIERLAELGVLGALVPAELGGLDLDLVTYAMLLEELGRGWTTVADLARVQTAAAGVLALGAQRASVPVMVRGERWAGLVVSDAVEARGDREPWSLHGTAPLVENAARSDLFVVSARTRGRGERAWCVVARGAPGLSVSEPLDTIGARGLGACDLVFDGVAAVAGPDLAAAEAVSLLGAAATAVGLAQAAFEAALRYSQQRSTFGTPICQHQAIQLKLADMATRITAARVLTYRAAERPAADGRDDHLARMARLEAVETASAVTLEAMRIHGGYGYTNEFPVERYYRDAAALLGRADAVRERRQIARGALERRGP